MSITTFEGKIQKPKFQTLNVSSQADLIEVPGVVVAGHFVDDGRDAVADVGEGPLLVLEERVTLHRIRTVETQPGRPENRQSNEFSNCSFGASLILEAS